ncbi:MULTISPECIES: NAD(P)/FAD-dependent oxidoreductase [Methylobacterium]|jgi:cation diffusion facilitator CzcD-associated flavoprotein CzcO|uniref:NAD(P)-binding domain-containing protein n=1 Tax=Methylobacterium TaxID=407 RepID=UPI0008F41EC1|nr:MULTISPECIES: NAD(P)/FAD-dependent oxidoreductase [Methylobacterium]MBZ6415853.1 NAD(P)/FAD-dependent oxidoreductase [Methylobacterium sp.]MBK3395194.1 NAD(P)/FAD-dependent oxidoreductase [Methylobacterium ajmalii]MBK3411199.1 NAD(P)/FAD-dependent oxidoreductase [Methylobacterium ajmalii]MBK3424033.1 NAD(P)/FAD-dependent oxidoreductase [Methylobacterium ajmalii]SFF39857.1 Predicted flavoprotein CzcO associated with the cation diffusion facilitator CzcD [Methylobacterium sp. yr596]
MDIDQDSAAVKGLTLLAAEVRRDLARLNHPPARWTLPIDGPEGRPALDVLVVGAGMCGQTAAFALLREGVSNIRVIDQAPRGAEGPWGTFARMETLRSPKHLTGPDLGIPSLTFRAWWEAQAGEAGWADLYKIPRLDWLRYLLFVRDTVGIPVENDTRLLQLWPADGLIGARIDGPAGPETLYARKVVLAAGRDGSGGRRMPSFATGGEGRLFHSSDPIDFSRFRGGRVAVLGASASAIDNAATALEAGAAEVTLFVRRSRFPQVNKSKWAAFPGFLRGYAALDDARRWAFTTYLMGEGTPPPHESVLRCTRHPNFAVRFGEGWTGIEEAPDGLVIETGQGRYPVEAAVVAVGFDIDLTRRPELDRFRDAVLTWGDRVPAAEAEAHPEAARFPYLGDGMQMLERVPGRLPELGLLHVFNWGVSLSHGALAGDIPGLGIGATRLAQALVRDLFVSQADAHFPRMMAHEDAELEPTPFFVARGAR